jgi:hypothetical protein
MMTGEQYRESIRDGRATYYLGKRIDDLSADPDLGKVVDLVASGYDHWYQPGPDARHPLMSPPRSIDEMRERIPLFAELDTLTDVTYGCMGTLVTAAGRLREEHPEISDRILSYVEDASTSGPPSASPTPRATAASSHRPRKTRTSISTWLTEARTALSSGAPSCTSQGRRSATT